MYFTVYKNISILFSVFLILSSLISTFQINVSAQNLKLRRELNSKDFVQNNPKTTIFNYDILNSKFSFADLTKELGSFDDIVVNSVTYINTPKIDIPLVTPINFKNSYEENINSFNKIKKLALDSFADQKDEQLKIFLNQDIPNDQLSDSKKLKEYLTEAKFYMNLDPEFLKKEANVEVQNLNLSYLKITSPRKIDFVEALSTPSEEVSDAERIYKPGASEISLDETKLQPKDFPNKFSDWGLS